VPRVRDVVTATSPAFAWFFLFLSWMILTPQNAGAVVCSSVQHNVQGYDASTSGRGNRGSVFVNNIDYSTLHGNIFRSLFVIKGTGPLDVEVGWLSTGGANPKAYFEYVTASGADSGAMQSSAVAKNTYPSFKVSAPGVANGSGNFSWTAYLGSASFNSVLLPFHIGKLRTNSERKNNCDTMYAEFTSLNNCSTVSGGACTWHSSYFDLECFKTVSGGEYLFSKVDNSHHFVQQVGGTTC
jgi:hypothetical protein